MPDRPKVLGQLVPGATTLTDLYAVPQATRAIVSTIFVCERGGADATFRISIAVGGSADATKQYLYFNSTVKANQTWPITTGITLNEGDVIRVYASSANLSFSAFGTELQ